MTSYNEEPILGKFIIIYNKKNIIIPIPLRDTHQGGVWRGLDVRNHSYPCKNEEVNMIN